MSSSYFSFLMNKPRKHLGRVDQRLLIQLSAQSSFGCCWWGISKHHWYLMVTILLKTVVVPDFLLWLFFRGLSLWLLTGMLVSSSSSIPPLPGGSLGEDRMQTDGSILLSAVSFGLGAAFHIVQMFNATEWCCFGSFVILGGAQCLQIFLSWKTICKKNPKKQKVENSE